MKSIRTAKFTIETERTFIFRNSEGRRQGWCPDCEAETQMATVADAARELELSELSMYQLLGSRSLHFMEDSDGRVLVCLNSILEMTRREK